MTRLYKIILPAALLLLLVLTSCNLGGAATPDPALFYTQAAETLIVAQTQTALAASPTPEATPTPQDTPIPEPTNTPLISPTFTPGAATNTPLVISTATRASASCDNALFVDDITIPDYSEVPAGAPFVKTWRFKNLGPCTWTTSYKVVFSYMSDNGKNGVLTPPAPVNFPETVLPGETVDLSVTITAPTKPDGYGVVFRLQNDKGFFFGPEFWVLFRVPGTPTP